MIQKYQSSDNPNNKKFISVSHSENTNINKMFDKESTKRIVALIGITTKQELNFDQPNY